MIGNEKPETKTTTVFCFDNIPVPSIVHHPYQSSHISMKLSVKSDYACRAVEALALHHPNIRPLRIDDIANKAAIPANYLVQILIELKGKGLIQSRRGKAGGYLLSRIPKEISVGDVVRAVEGDVFAMSTPANSASPQELLRAWNRIRVAAENAADNITFDQLCAEASGRGPMYYI